MKKEEIKKIETNLINEFIEILSKESEDKIFRTFAIIEWLERQKEIINKR